MHASLNVFLGAVYPRWRGEHFVFADSKDLLHGLSPLARGTLSGTTRQIRPPRFIPAGAGNTADNTRGHSNPAVYPRWRGEHIMEFHFLSCSIGLSPLARGTLPHSVNSIFRSRFIPAGAGNTWHNPISSCDHAVYPRWRGEHQRRMPDGAIETGLSPLARGTRSKCRQREFHPRFIPAGAGNTANQGRKQRGDSVYPRWRGEHVDLKFMMEDSRGLSPLARGTP